jgi:hypothetical protein
MTTSHKASPDLSTRILLARLLIAFLVIKSTIYNPFYLPTSDSSLHIEDMMSAIHKEVCNKNVVVVVVIIIIIIIIITRMTVTLVRKITCWMTGVQIPV